MRQQAGCGLFRRTTIAMRHALVAAALVIGLPLEQAAFAETGAKGAPDCGTGRDDVAKLMRQLIEAENSHDMQAVSSLVWQSPNTLFVAKTATPREGNWAGFWGYNIVLQHFRDLYKSTFHMEPDYSRQRVADLTCDVVEVYLPTTISVAYAGQEPAPKPFILFFNWVRTQDGWRMAADVALPIPPSPKPEH